MLIVVEGNVGVGKSTLVNRISNKLGIKTTKWNSTELISPLIKNLRKTNKLNNALLYEYLQLADFSIRYNNFTKNGITEDIICDRYIYTIYVRSLIRNLEENHVITLCEQYVKPDIVFYLYLDNKECLKRIAKRANPTNDMWTIGMETNLIKEDFDETMFLDQQRRSDMLYRKILKNEKNVYYIDSSKEIDEIENDVSKIIQKRKMELWES